MDLQIFYLINNLAAKNPVLDAVAVFFAKFAIFFLGLGAVIVVAKYGKKAAVTAGLAFIVVLLSDFVLNLLISTPRPFVENNVNLIIEAPAGPTFPSTHAALSAAAAILIFEFLIKTLGFAAIIFAILVGVSRIFVGVHYPIDVLVGWVIGVTSYIISVKLTKLAHLGENAGGKKNEKGKQEGLDPPNLSIRLFNTIRIRLMLRFKAGLRARKARP